MPHTNLRSIVGRTLALPVLLLVSVAVVLSLWIVHLVRSENWVQHTYSVIAQINDAERRLVDQETGLRAYILTADAQFLEPYDSSGAQFQKGLESLAQETKDNPAQSRRIEELQQRYLKWREGAEEEKRIVAASREGALRDAAGRNRLVVRKQSMDQMRADFTSMHGEESRLLTLRQEAADRANLLLVSVGSAVVVLFAAVLVFFLRRQLSLIDDIYLAKVSESEQARLAAEALAEEVREQAAAMEQALLSANRERDAAVRTLRESENR